MVLSTGGKRDDLVVLRRMKPLVSHSFGRLHSRIIEDGTITRILTRLRRATTR